MVTVPVFLPHLMAYPLYDTDSAASVWMHAMTCPAPSSNDPYEGKAYASALRSP